MWKAKEQGRTAEDSPHQRILLNIATTDIMDLRGTPYNLVNDQLAYEFAYDALILKIVWELMDNDRAAKIIGVGDLEDLVAMLEAASRCEAKFKKYGMKVRECLPLTVMWGEELTIDRGGWSMRRCTVSRTASRRSDCLRRNC